MSSQASPKIIFWDLETSHNIIAKFDLKEEYTNPSNVLVERYIFCAAWNELGKNKIHSVSLLDDPKRFSKNIHDDYFVVKTLHNVLSEADVLVAHNGDCFDLPWLNGRILFHGLKPLPPIQTVDTLKQARKRFNLNSFRLDYLGKFLGLGGKMSTPTGLWLEALGGNEKAIRDMATYNKRDVELLRDVFLKLQPFMPDALNRALHGQDGCPRCASMHVQSRGFHRSLTQVYRRMQCVDCGGWFRSAKCEKSMASKVKVI